MRLSLWCRSSVSRRCKLLKKANFHSSARVLEHWTNLKADIINTFPTPLHNTLNSVCLIPHRPRDVKEVWEEDWLPRGEKETDVKRRQSKITWGIRFTLVGYYRQVWKRQVSWQPPVWQDPDSDPVEVCVSERIPEGEEQETCLPPTLVSVCAHRFMNQCNLHKELQLKTRQLTQRDRVDAAQCGGWGTTEQPSVQVLTRSVHIVHFPFSASSLLWKEIELTRQPLIRMFVAFQIPTYKADAQGVFIWTSNTGYYYIR